MFFLSWRQLMAKKKQTLLILLGISLATLIFIGISGVQLGMRQYMLEQLLNTTAHVLISGAEQSIEPQDVTAALFAEDRPIAWVTPPAGKRDEVRLESYSKWYELLSADPSVFDFSPRLTANVLITNGKFTASVAMVGVLPERHMRVTSIEKYMKEGSFKNLATGGNQIVIGSEVAKKLGARLNQFVHVTGGAGLIRPFRIAGIVHYGNKQFDETIAYAGLTNTQAVTRSPGRVTEIAVALLDPDHAAVVADDWQLFSADKVEDWQEANKAFMEIINVQDFSRYFITTAILIVAAFGIYNVLTIMINQKRREIAILRAIGYAPKKILTLILYQGIVLGFSGGVLGLLLGYLLCRWVGSVDFGFEIGGSNNLLISYDWSIYVTAFITAFSAAVVASFIPAWSASRMTPMDIMRSES